MTDIDEAKWFQYFSTSQNSISTVYEKKINFLGFRAVALEDLSIDVSITNVGLISTKLEWIQHFGTSRNTSQNSIKTFFEKKI